MWYIKLYFHKMTAHLFLLLSLRFINDIRLYELLTMSHDFIATVFVRMCLYHIGLIIDDANWIMPKIMNKILSKSVAN